jgi:hypothetical protein
MDSYATSIYGLGGFFNGVRAARAEMLSGRRVSWLELAESRLRQRARAPVPAEGSHADC